MQISAETKKISELLPIAVKTLKYVIPSFQRPYSWKNEQIEQLFIDIKDEALGYYAGNILVTGDESALNVIDGSAAPDDYLVILPGNRSKAKARLPYR